MTRPAPDFEALFRVLDTHGVRYVVIGGVASRAHGDPSVTFDLDITPSPDVENLDRLAAALRELDALIRPPGADPVAFEFDAAVIGRFSTLATRTRCGDLDIVVRPDGIPGGYEQLAANAVHEQAYGVQIAIAGVADIVAPRRAAAEITGQDRYRLLADRLSAQGSARHQPTDTPRPVTEVPAPTTSHPDWLVELLGPRPAPRATGVLWDRAAQMIGDYRRRWEITDDGLGPTPPQDSQQATDRASLDRQLQRLERMIGRGCESPSLER